MSVSERQLDQLVTAADPAPDSPDAAALDQVWARVSPSLDAGIVTPFRRRGRLIRVGVGIAALAALTAAAAPFIATRTGEWNTPEWVAVGGPGEDYRLNGTDFAQEIAALGTDIPYPDQASREEVLQNMDADLGSLSEPAVASTGALRAYLARGAICAWARTWQSANTAGDAQLRTTSTDALASALTWKAVTDIDPHPSIDGDKTDTGYGPTPFGHLPGIIDAARHDNPTALAEGLEEGEYYCAYNDKRVYRGVAVPPSAQASGRTTPTSTAPSSKK